MCLAFLGLLPNSCQLCFGLFWLFSSLSPPLPTKSLLISIWAIWISPTVLKARSVGECRLLLMKFSRKEIQCKFVMVRGDFNAANFAQLSVDIQRMYGTLKMVYLSRSVPLLLLAETCTTYRLNYEPQSQHSSSTPSGVTDLKLLERVLSTLLHLCFLLICQVN